MKSYWSFEPIPGWEDISKKERRKIWRQCALRALRNPEAWAALIGLGACGGMAAWIGITISDNGIIHVICAGIGGAVGGFFFGPLLARTARHYVLKELKSHEQMSTTDENK